MADLWNNGFLGLFLGSETNGLSVPVGIALTVGGFVFCMIVAYLIGSVNFGILLSHRLGSDVRDAGSGNAGATNMTRTYGLKIGILTFLGDGVKGAVAVILARFVFGYAFGCCYFAAFFAVLGHAFPIYFRFRGGKGVSCAFGALIALNWALAALALLVFLLLALGTKYISLGSIMAAVTLPLFADRLSKLPALPYIPGFGVIACFLIGALIVFLHRENIRRLLNGTEPKMTRKAMGSGSGNGKGDA